ncbi:unnamed protein product [Rotaria magnacalcarata]|nr:unnamed protein product [Rotaria magnacalcarata]
MIPSSKAAFQVMVSLIAFVSIVTWGLTIYLLGFHIYLCYYGMSTYDYVVSQRINRTVNQTISQFSQFSLNYQNNSSSKPLKSIFQKRRRSIQIGVDVEHDTMNRSKQSYDQDIFTVEGNHRDSARRLQVCRSSTEEAYVLRGASQIDNGSSQ